LTTLDTSFAELERCMLASIARAFQIPTHLISAGPRFYRGPDKPEAEPEKAH